MPAIGRAPKGRAIPPATLCAPSHCMYARANRELGARVASLARMTTRRAQKCVPAEQLTGAARPPNEGRRLCTPTTRVCMSTARMCDHAELCEISGVARVRAITRCIAARTRLLLMCARVFHAASAIALHVVLTSWR